MRKKTDKNSKKNFSSFKNSEKPRNEGDFLKEKFGYWGDFLKNFAQKFFADFANKFFAQIEESIRKKIIQVLLELKKALITAILFAMGGAFFLVGLAGALDELIGFSGAGFLLLGTILIFLGWFSAVMTQKPKE